MATIDDLRTLGYEAGVAFDWTQRQDLPAEKRHVTYRVEGFGISMHVGDVDLALIESLCDPALHCERKFQHEQPEAHQARQELRRMGYTVERADPQRDEFDVAGPGSALAAKSPDELVELCETLPSHEPPTAEDQIAALEQRIAELEAKATP